MINNIMYAEKTLDTMLYLEVQHFAKPYVLPDDVLVQVLVSKEKSSMGHSPLVRRWLNALSQTSCLLPAFGQYQFMPLGNRGTWV